MISPVLRELEQWPLYGTLIPHKCRLHYWFLYISTKHQNITVSLLRSSITVRIFIGTVHFQVPSVNSR